MHLSEVKYSSKGTSEIMKGYNLLFSGEKDMKRNGDVIIVKTTEQRITETD